MKKQFLILLVTLCIATTFAQTVTRRVREFNLENKVAIQGYDPVAYFKKNKAVKGTVGLSIVYEGVIYYFSTQASKDIFLKNPTSFEPQFGGWCAYAMGSLGDKVEINPDTFKIIEGKLYLFYNAYFNNTLKSWNKDEVTLKAKAENNWKKL